MTTIINGSSPSITFSDSTTQTTAGLTGSTQQLCQAWGLFSYNGSGITINASYNVSSITLSATGVYRITMTNALADANYLVVGMGNQSTAYPNGYIMTKFDSNSAPTSSAFTIQTFNIATVANDIGSAGVGVFR